MITPKPSTKLFPYTTLFRSVYNQGGNAIYLSVFENTGGLLTQKKYWESGPWWSINNTKLVSSADFNSDGKSEHSTQVWYYLRSEEHASELQSQFHLVCRLLL